MHLFACPVIKEMMNRLPTDALKLYNANVVVKTANFFSEAFDFGFNWWFVLIPLAGLGIQLPYLILRRQNDQAARAVLVIITSLLSVTIFISLSTQLMTICMLIPNFLK